ncbi:AaceriAER100Cp [[Ashbya] aceris (nom. inval.)]|nr:AaceriAER100Cp [[Ashbya] aceris (nom. inval.)]
MDTVRSISARDPVRFRAGVCQYEEESKQCTPKAAGGTVTIQPSEEAEGFYDFVWRPEEEGRGAEAIELILIPGETRWVHIQSCKTGRVFCLVFSSGEKYFFWMQERGGEDAGALSEQDRQALARIENALRVAEEAGEEEDVEMADAEQPATEHM